MLGPHGVLECRASPAAGRRHSHQTSIPLWQLRLDLDAACVPACIVWNTLLLSYLQLGTSELDQAIEVKLCAGLCPQ